MHLRSESFVAMMKTPDSGEGNRLLQERLDALAAQGEAVTLGELTQAYALPPGMDNAADLGEGNHVTVFTSNGTSVG